MTAVPAGEDIWVEISRDGFSGYSTTGLKSEFVLEREFGAADIPRIAALEGSAQWKGNNKPRFNQKGDKAPVDREFVAGRDRLIYPATFHKTEGQWQLRGVHETMQVLMAREVE